MSDAALIDQEHAVFMQRGVSINIGSCGLDKRPSVARAVGCTVSPDLKGVRLLVSAHQASEVIEHVRQSGALAAVFSEPPTHRTIQIKARDARVEPATDADLTVVHRYRHAFVRCLDPMGYRPDLIYALLHCPDADLVALSFTPCAAFSQTPGPGAGQALRSGA